MIERKNFIFLLIVTYLIIAATSAMAQTNNPRAVNWFKKGVAETEPQKKIEAYQKAIEFEPYFVEALYNLGMVYRKTSRHELAKKYLTEAYKAKPLASGNKLLPRILYNLAAIEKRLDHFSESEKLLRDAALYAKDRRLQSRISFDLARLLYETKRYDEALAELNAGIRKFQESRSIFNNMIQIIETEKELEKFYIDAERAINNGDYAKAQTLFFKVKAKKPDFRDIDQKMVLTDSLLRSKSDRDFVQQMYQLAEQHTQNGTHEKAISAYNSILEKNPGDLKAQRKLEDAKTKQIAKQNTNTLKQEYTVGIAALLESDWTRAILAFEKVLKVNATYRDTNERLLLANQGLEKQSTNMILRQYYRAGIQAMERNELGAAYSAFEKVHSIEPDYRNTGILMSQIEKLLQANIAAGPMPADYFNTQYDIALTAMQTKDWMQAILVLEKLRLLAPDNKNLVVLLGQARENFKLSKPAKAEEQQFADSKKLFFLGGAAVAGLIGLPFLGFVALSPTSRARFHYLRGNYLKAAGIYERSLSKHPQKLKLYSKLANIYLLLGRNDERALRIYRMVLNLDLSTNLHQQIKSVVPQKYLQEGNAAQNTLNEAA